MRNTEKRPGDLAIALVLMMEKVCVQAYRRRRRQAAKHRRAPMTVVSTTPRDQFRHRSSRSRAA